MEQSLLYLREILSAHTDSDGVGSQLYHKLSSQNYQDELQFIRELSQEESTYLHQILMKPLAMPNKVKMRCGFNI